MHDVDIVFPDHSCHLACAAEEWLELGPWNGDHIDSRRLCSFEKRNLAAAVAREIGDMNVETGAVEASDPVQHGGLNSPVAARIDQVQDANLAWLALLTLSHLTLQLLYPAERIATG